MTAGNSFIICSLFYSTLLIFIFFSKKRLESIENKIFKTLLITNFIGLLLELANYFTVFHIEEIPVLNFFISRLYLIYLLTWMTLFTIYIMVISMKKVDLNKNDKLVSFKNKFRKFFLIYLVFVISIVALPLYYHNNNNFIYSYGPAVNASYIAGFLCVLVELYYIMKNIRNIKSKKYLPVFIFLTIGTLVMILQAMYPQLLLITSMETLITILMYFTIENPDIKMLNQLELAKTHAEKANRAKSEFLSSMSHEIRTPLNAIVGFSEMIETENNMEACKEDAKDIVMASHTLLEIVNGVLDISKIEANKMEIVNKNYNLLPELENISKLMIPRIGEKPIELKTKFAEDIPDIMYGDIGKIKQVITNILTNAVKYTEQGTILFDVKCINENESSSLIISVSDTGRGIKPEQIDSLFTKFNRLEEDRNTTLEGTGLGLAITKSLVEMMGGKIVVQSKYGEGSTFTIYLNQKIVQLHGGSKIIDVEKEELNNQDFTGYKVLIVDDNKLNLKIADKILKKYNLDTNQVESGKECIEIIEKGEKYDLILLDDMMPRMSGIETLSRLKQIEKFNIPTVALTANALSGMREKYLSIGFDDYLGKPIEKIELINVLNKFLKQEKENKIEEEQEEPQLMKNEPSKENKIEEEKIEYKEHEGKKILIVDDNKMNIKIASGIMKPYKFTIEEAISGQECLNKIKETTYDIIFMDIMMPEMDGIETLHNLRKENYTSKVVALTADAGDGARIKFLEEGFDEYVAKPIIKKELNIVIEEMIDASQENDMKSMNEIEKNEYKKNEQFSSVYITKEENKGNVEYLKRNHIDVEHGLELLGDIDMYNETLDDFMNEIENRKRKLDNYKNDMENYAIEVHALKSDSKYLGFVKLAEMALEHEKKSKENDTEYVMNNYDALIEEVNNIIRIVKEYI